MYIRGTLFALLKKISFTMLICPNLYKYNYYNVISNSWTLVSDVLSKIANCSVTSLASTYSFAMMTIHFSGVSVNEVLNTMLYCKYNVILYLLLTIDNYQQLTPYHSFKFKFTKRVLSVVFKYIRVNLFWTHPAFYVTFDQKCLGSAQSIFTVK